MIIQHLLAAPSALPTDASAQETSILVLKNCISALENSINTLEGSSTGWETLAWICSVAVAVGVTAEIIGIVWGYREERNAWRRGIIRPPDHLSILKFWFEIAATVLVVAGVFGEAGASAELASLNSQLRSLYPIFGLDFAAAWGLIQPQPHRGRVGYDEPQLPL